MEKYAENEVPIPRFRHIFINKYSWLRNIGVSVNELLDSTEDRETNEKLSWKLSTSKSGHSNRNLETFKTGYFKFYLFHKY